VVKPTRRFKTTSLRLLVRRDLDEGTARAAILPFLSRRGSNRLPSQQALSRGLEELGGASIGVDVAKIGETQLLVYRLDVLADRFLAARNGGSRLERSLDLFLGVIFDPASPDGSCYPSDTFRLERRNLRRRVESLFDDKTSLATHRLLQVMCKDEPYARLELGTLEEIDALDNEETFAFRRAIVERAPIDVLVVGDVDPERLFAQIRDGSPLGKRDQATDSLRPVERRGGRGGKVVIEPVPSNQPRIVLGYRSTLPFGDPLLPALRVASSLLGGGAHSLLFREVRERLCLAYSISTGLESVKGLLLVRAAVDCHGVPGALGAVKEQVDRLKEGRFEETSLDKARRILVSRLGAARDSSSRMLDIATDAAVTGGSFSVEARIAELEAVSREDVISAARSLDLDTVLVLRDDRRARPATRQTLPEALAANLLPEEKRR